MDAQNLLANAGASQVANCCDTCDEARASGFKAGLPTKRVRVQIAPNETSNRNAWVRYKTEKCGPLEYNIYDPNWVMSAVQRTRCGLCRPISCGSPSRPGASRMHVWAGRIGGPDDGFHGILCAAGRAAHG